MAKLVRRLSRTGEFNHPLLDANGWWQKKQNVQSIDNNRQRLLLIANDSSIFDCCKIVCRHRGIEFNSIGGNRINQFDIPWDQISNACNPWAIIVAYREDEFSNKNESIAAAKKLISKLSVVCTDKKIPLMFFDQDHITNEGSHIGIRYKNNSTLLSSDVWDRSLDLLIDEASGDWRLDNQGKFTRIKPKESLSKSFSGNILEFQDF